MERIKLPKNLEKKKFCIFFDDNINPLSSFEKRLFFVCQKACIIQDKRWWFLEIVWWQQQLMKNLLLFRILCLFTLLLAHLINENIKYTWKYYKWTFLVVIIVVLLTIWTYSSEGCLCLFRKVKKLFFYSLFFLYSVLRLFIFIEIMPTLGERMEEKKNF